MQLASLSVLAVVGAGAARSATSGAPPQLDHVMLFGFLAAFATIVCAVLPPRSHTNLLMFSVCLAACAVYGFMQGAWPIGFTEGAWSIFAFVRWRRVARNNVKEEPRASERPFVAESTEADSRVARLFGSK